MVGNGGYGKDDRSYLSAKHAMKALFEGHRITRKHSGWESESVALGDENSFSLDVEDLEADDWYIVR